jgi:hypothetical protein
MDGIRPPATFDEWITTRKLVDRSALADESSRKTKCNTKALKGRQLHDRYPALDNTRSDQHASTERVDKWDVDRSIPANGKMYNVTSEGRWSSRATGFLEDEDHLPLSVAWSNDSLAWVTTVRASTNAVNDESIEAFRPIHTSVQSSSRSGKARHRRFQASYTRMRGRQIGTAHDYSGTPSEAQHASSVARRLIHVDTISGHQWLDDEPASHTQKGTTEAERLRQDENLQAIRSLLANQEEWAKTWPRGPRSDDDDDE